MPALLAIVQCADFALFCELMALYAMVSTNKSAQYTEYALKSFFAHTALTSEDNFLLINNDGEGDSGSFPVSVMNNQVPLSFAANANQAAREALKRKTDLFFLNNDVIFTRGWSEGIVFDVNAIVVPLSNREVQYNMPISPQENFTLTMRMSLAEYLGHEVHIDQIAEHHKRQTTSVMPLLKVICAPFFVVRIPYAVLNSIGGFDERYGAGGGEDYDYCLRAALAGFSVAYLQKSFVLHFGGKSIAEVANNVEPEFIGIFRRKWGEKLTRLIFDDAQAALEQTGFTPYDFQKEGFRRLIQEVGNIDSPIKFPI